MPNLTSNIMYQISYILEILVVFKINGKMKKIKILDLQYNSYSNDFWKFYAVFLCVTLFRHDIQLNRIQNRTLPMYDTLFAVFALINKK